MVFRAIFDKIKQGLARTRGVFSGVASLFRLRGKVDKDFLDELEKRLYLADVGIGATGEIVGRVRQAFLDKEITGDVEAFVKQQLKDMLTAEGTDLHWNPAGPTVILVAGVNGSGKTTSIAKLAKRLQNDGKKVMVAACDTFRAAAVEQLTIWSQRHRLRDRQEPAGQRPGQRGPRRLRAGQGARLRRADRGHRRPAAHADAPDARAGEDPPRRRASRSTGRRTRCCWCWTPRRARTPSPRRRCSRRRCNAPASSCRSWTAPPRAARSSPSSRSSACRSSSSASARSSTTWSRSTRKPMSKALFE